MISKLKTREPESYDPNIISKKLVELLLINPKIIGADGPSSGMNLSEYISKRRRCLESKELSPGEIEYLHLKYVEEKYEKDSI